MILASGGLPSDAGSLHCLHEESLLVISGGLIEVGRAAQVAPVRIVGGKRDDILSPGRQIQISINDGEGAFFLHEGEEARRDDVDAGESEGLRVRGDADDFLLLQDLAAAEVEIVVEKQLAGTSAALDCQGGEGLLRVMKIEHAAKIDGADDIHVVKDKRFIPMRRILEEKSGGFFQAAAGIE